ncbi:MAG TPA: branched-chain amino acid ABC transporter permease [Alphaproteobacteria bacterium]|nr:branched-chain amino acid ABC transporter permease [Alphaproteobacteria bacterium]
MLDLGGLVGLVLNAATLICILMLVGLGLAIIFGLMNVINMAHGEFVTLGAFTLSFVQSVGGNYWLALALAPLVGAAAGLLLERSIVQWLYTRPLATILATWGVSLILQQLLQLIFGSGPQQASGPIEGAVRILGTSYPAYRLLLIAFAVAIVATIIYVFRRTRFGLDLRTVIQDRDMAEALGINTGRVYAIAFSAGAALAAIAGVLIAPLTKVIALMGANYLAPSFFVVIVGGAGSVAGVAAGSTVVGGLETILNYQVPVTVSQALVLIVAVVIVRFRPRGLIPT